MRWYLPQPLNVLFTGFTVKLWVVVSRHVRLRISVDVAELPAEPYIDPVVFPSIVLLSMLQEALAYPGLHLLRDLNAPRLRIIYPHLSWHLFFLPWLSNFDVDCQIAAFLILHYDMRNRIRP